MQVYDRRWINKFIRLCSKGNNKDYSKAMKLKDGKIPPKLYQYRSIAIEPDKDRFQWLCDILEKGQVFCSTRSGLNDPFDIRSILSNNTASPYYNIVPMYTAAKLFKPLIKMWFKRNGVPEKDILWFDSEFENEFMRSVEEVHSQFDVLLDKLKIACFTETSKNLPMWWFYADERRGVCLEFDTNRINHGEKLFMFPVKYTDILPDTMKNLPRSC